MFCEESGIPDGVYPYPLLSKYDYDDDWIYLYNGVMNQIANLLNHLKEHKTQEDVLDAITALSVHPKTILVYIFDLKSQLADVYIDKTLIPHPLMDRGVYDSEWLRRYRRFQDMLAQVHSCPTCKLPQIMEDFHETADIFNSHSGTNTNFTEIHIKWVTDCVEKWYLKRKKPKQEKPKVQNNLVHYRLRHFDVGTHEERNAFLISEFCPLHHIVGNEQAIEVLRWILADAMTSTLHKCPQNLAFLGPSSAGKTMISRLFAKTLGIPHLEISPRAVRSPQDIIDAIAETCNKEKVPFAAFHKLNGDYLVPPMVILLDEAHALPNMIQQVLLKATERNDTRLITEKGLVANCQCVCWHIATTELGKMFDALMTRFRPIRLRLYTKDEIAEIIHRKYPDWEYTLCQGIAKFCSRVPREAIHFAEMVKMAQNYNNQDAISQVQKVAELSGIDPFGMSYQRLAVLKALGRKPMSASEICATVGVKEEELKVYIMPWLLEATPDQEPYVVVTNRHYITRVGLEELDKRGIIHRGEKVLPKS
jgi:Holliday junction resolvasome RuvABC ATP-dependent DNA helicase subunit